MWACMGMGQVEDVAGLAAHLGVPEAVLTSELAAYNAAASGAQADAHGKTAFPTGRSFSSA